MCYCVDRGVNWVIDNNSVFACVMFLVDCTFAFCIETCCVIVWSTTTAVAGICDVIVMLCGNSIRNWFILLCILHCDRLCEYYDSHYLTNITEV